jgi:glycosyltransferase involved in cell wall biosynthesis
VAGRGRKRGFTACSKDRDTAHPHSLFVRQRADLLRWQTPLPEVRAVGKNERPVIVFPSSTVGRKGCYELREALRRLDIKLITLGPYIESPDFWNGFDVEKGDKYWLERADLVVLPAHVEHRPRRLLAAVAHGIPVIATPNCGVSESDGIQLVAADDPESLKAAITRSL